MDSHQSDFYLKLGELASKFSNLEYYAGVILSKLINKNEGLLTAYLVEDMTFYKRIEMIKNISDFRTPNRKIEEDLNNLVASMSSLRKTRNLFVHGLWDNPVEGNTGYSIHVRELKISKTKLEDNGTEWKYSKRKTFSKGTFEKLNKQLDLTIAFSIQIIKEIEETDDF